MVFGSKKVVSTKYAPSDILNAILEHVGPKAIASLPTWELEVITIVITVISMNALVILFRNYSKKNFKYYANLTASHKRDHDQRITSILHSLLVCSLVAYLYFYTPLFSIDVKKHGAVMLRSHPIAKLTMSISLGYFIFDSMSIANEYPALGDVGLIMHHFVSMFTVYYAISRPYGHMYMMWVLFSEVTTPFINAKFMLEYAGYKSHPLFGLNGLCIFFGWIFGRILLFTYYFVRVKQFKAEMAMLPPVGLVVLLVLPSIISVLNLVWFEKICRGVLKHFFKKKDRSVVAEGAAAANAVGKTMQG